MEVVVDTSFLLPTLGVDVEEEVYDAIRLFRRVEVFYLEVSLLEALWKLARLGVDPGRIALGVDAIRRTYRLLTPGPEAFSEALELYRLGHRDLVDDLLYAAASSTGRPLLTVDRAFIDFLREVGRDASVAVTPRRFADLLGRR